MSLVKRPWVPMEVSTIGHVGDVLKGGGGKLTIPTGDPGEPLRKPPGLENLDPGPVPPNG